MSVQFNTGFSRIQYCVTLSILVLAGLLLSDLFSDSTAAKRISGNGAPAIVHSSNDRLDKRDNMGSERVADPEPITDMMSIETKDSGAPQPITVADEHRPLSATTLLSLNALVQNALVPALQSLERARVSSDTELEAQSRRDHQAALTLLMDTLPAELSPGAEEQVLQVLYDYLPVADAESVFEKVLVLHLVTAQQESYIASLPAISTMQEQITAAENLASISDEIETSAGYASTRQSETEDGIQEGKDIDTPTVDPYAHLQDAESGQQALEDLESRWLHKYQTFKAQKKRITQAGLSDSDKAAQIEALFRQHYTDNEQHAARAFDRMMQAQDDPPS